MFIISTALLIAIGWLIDKNGTVEESMFWNCEGLWFSLFSSFAVSSGMSVKLYNKYYSQHGRYSKLYIIIISCIIIFNSICIGFSLKYVFELSEYSASEPAIEVIDITETNIYAKEINLSSLKKMPKESKKETLVYIGRGDCYECAKFEKVLDSFLNKEKMNCYIYYTDSDRDGPRGEEMYEFLGEIHITSVPAVVLFKNGSIKKIWLDPVNEINEIKESI